MARSRRRRVPHGAGAYAAPVAFLLAATVVVLLVRSALHQTPTRPPRTGPVATAPAARSQPATKAPAARVRRPRRYLVVQAGDTFGTIAARAGTTVARVEQLNPGVASTSLHVGQRLRVR